MVNVSVRVWESYESITVVFISGSPLFEFPHNRRFFSVSSSLELLPWILVSHVSTRVDWGSFESFTVIFISGSHYFSLPIIDVFLLPRDLWNWCPRSAMFSYTTVDCLVYINDSFTLFTGMTFSWFSHCWHGD